MPNRRAIEDDTDDTEGNSLRTGRVSDGVEDDTDDTQGNSLRTGHVSDGVEDDDTEGNAACTKH